MRIAVLLLVLLLPASVQAGINTDGFAWDQYPGAQVPASTVLRDEAGRDVTLANALGNTAAILDLGYFHCPSLCGVTRADLLAALQAGGLSPGRDFSVLAVSIDPAERPADASAAKHTNLAHLPASWDASVHYLTATQDGIAALERSVGFHAVWDARFKQFMHPAGIVVLTRTGRISSYLMGVGYTPGDMRAAVLRAGDGGIARAALPILLLCFHFDQATGRYTLAVMKLLRLLAGLTVLTLAGLFWALRRRDRKHAARPDTLGPARLPINR